MKGMDCGFVYSVSCVTIEMSGEMIKFAKIQVEGWRQFDSVEIDLHRRMTIITGANGSGKTTILNVLSQHFGWSLAFIGTLRISKKGARRYYSGVDSTTDEGSTQVDVGTLTYTDGSSAILSVPIEGDSFQIALRGQQTVPGIYITSHRPVYSYQKVDSIPTEIEAGDQLFQQYLNNVRQHYQPRARVESPSYRLKAALLSLATFGYDSEAVRGDQKARETFEGFSDVLRLVLPADLGFRGISIRRPDVVLECRTGDFSIDASSGGVAALMDVAWQIFMQSRIDAEFCVVMDEPENHLHPRLQRSMLPSLLDAFPGAQFVIATHNPFVVTSVQDSNIFVLDFADAGVRSTRLAEVDKSASANQVLADVLGVPFPAPLWVESEVERIAAAAQSEELSEELLARIRLELSDVGLGSLFPQVVDRVLPSEDDSIRSRD
jgi:predicted ATPase